MDENKLFDGIMVLSLDILGRQTFKFHIHLTNNVMVLKVFNPDELQIAHAKFGVIIE